MHLLNEESFLFDSLLSIQQTPDSGLHKKDKSMTNTTVGIWISIQLFTGWY